MKTLLTRITSIAALFLLFAFSPVFAANNPEDSSKANLRYIIKGGEVYDKISDLTWQRCSVGQQWQEGVGCAGAVKTFAFNEALRQGVGEWHVPTKAELRTLIDVTRVDSHQKPVIDVIAFPAMGEGQLAYWTDMPFDTHGWYVRFSDGFVSYGDYRSFYAAVRLVRKGQ